MNIIINANGNSNVTITGTESLVSNDTTFEELLSILRTRPEAAEASRTEQEEKKREEDLARLHTLLGEDFDLASSPDDAGAESSLVKEKRRPGAMQLRTSVPRIARIELGADSLCEVFSTYNGIITSRLWTGMSIMPRIYSSLHISMQRSAARFLR